MGGKSNALFRWGFIAAALLVVMHARATTIQVYIDTSSLGINGQNWDLAFDLTDGNPASNSVSISSFAITGGALTGAAGYPTLTGNVTGNLSDAPGIVTLNDSSPVPMSFFNEYLDNANIGTLITFVLNLTDNKDSGLEPDTFALFFVNPTTGATLPTSDPTGADALFIFSIGNDDQPTQFCPSNTNCLRVAPVVVAVPEPSAVALLSAALLLLGFARAGRTVPARRGANA